MARTKDEMRMRRRLLRLTPATAGKVVSKDVYWTVPFLEMYLEHCDEMGFDVPADAHRMALHAPSLARMIGVGTRLGEYIDEFEKRSYEVIAIAMVAGLCRQVGRFVDAQSYYAQAFEICEHQVSVRARAELFRRYGALRTALQKNDSVGYFDAALELCVKGEDYNGMAETLVWRGVWHGLRKDSGKAIVDFASAIANASQKDSRGRRVIASALTNLAYEASESRARLTPQAAALDFLVAAKKQYHRGLPAKLRAKMLWVEGLLYRNLCYDRRAMNTLHRARKRIHKIGDPLDFALISLDLALVFSEEHQFEQLQELRRETMTVLCTLSEDPALLQVLAQWGRSLKSKSLRDIRKCLEVKKTA